MSRDDSQRKIIPLMFRLLNSTGELAIETLLDEYPCARTLKRQLTQLNDIYFEWSGKQNYLFEFTNDVGTKTDKIYKDGFVRLLNTVVIDQFNIYQMVALYSNKILLNRNVGELLEGVNDSIISGSDQKISTKHRQSLEFIERKFFSYGIGSIDFDSKNRITKPDVLGVKESDTIGEILNEVFTGLIHQRRLEVIYKNSKGQEKKYIIRPLTLVTYKNSLYLLAQYDWRPLSDQAAVLKIDNFISVDTLKSSKTDKEKINAHFEYPKNHDPAEYFAEDFGIFRMRNQEAQQVVLEFHDSLFDYLNTKKWAKGQTLEMSDTGDYCTLTFDTANLLEVKSWVLSFGDMCKVVAPDSLKNDILESLENTIGQYQKKLAKAS